MIIWSPKQQRPSPIGLDIGHAYIKMIQLVGDRKGLQILSAQRCSFPKERSAQTVAAAIRRLYESGNFHGRKTVVSLPNEGLRTTSIHMSDEDLAQGSEQLSQWLAKRYGFNLEQETVRHIVVGYQHPSEPSRNEVILLAADNTEIDERIHLLLDSGLDPAGLDPVGSSLFRCYDRIWHRQEDLFQSILYIDIGAKYTTVTFGRGHQLCFIKQLSMGSDQIRERVALALGVDINESDTLRERVQQWMLSCETAGQNGLGRLYEPELGQSVGLDRSTQHMIRDAVSAALQDLAHEVGLCMRYYSVTFRGHPVHRAILSGGAAQDRILIHSLGQHLGLDLVSAAPLAHLHTRLEAASMEHQNQVCQWSVALGLAFKGWDMSCLPRKREKASRLVPAVCVEVNERDD
jgi:type IV pilus assembly protein PilM